MPSLESFDAGDRHEPGPTIFAQKPWAGVASGVVAAASQEHADASREADHRRLDPDSAVVGAGTRHPASFGAAVAGPLCQDAVMTTFGLIHGAWHGAWCWDRLVVELERRGHRAVAVDLPCDDWSATVIDNARMVADAVGDDSDVVVVAHSLGGLVAPVVAIVRPIRRVVFLCGLVPRPGRVIGDVLDEEPGAFVGTFAEAPRIVADDGSVTWDPEVAVEAFYRDLDGETAHWAAARLRSQVWTSSQEPCPLDRWPDCELASIVCTGDGVLVPEWCRRVARDVLGVEPIELPSGHFPMLSHPVELANALLA
jgi:pimeloyl-ACP methyl ester carboxylesterase